MPFVFAAVQCSLPFGASNLEAGLLWHCQNNSPVRTQPHLSAASAAVCLVHNQHLVFGTLSHPHFCFCCSC
jgi:hypothetical protein